MFNDSVTGNSLIEKHMDFVFLVFKVKKKHQAKLTLFLGFLLTSLQFPHNTLMTKYSYDW